MKLKLDRKKKYAIALQGGGARGGFEVGVWKALREAGISYNAVAGTSVGALIGAMMTVGDLETAEKAWAEMSIDKVISIPDEYEDGLRSLVSYDFSREGIKSFAPALFEILKNGGLDVGPLRAWMHASIDPEKIRSSDVEFFITTLDLTDMQGLYVRVKDLPAENIVDMLLASAYHPSFKLETLGGRFYSDGGLVDQLPITPLIESGYRDIIAVKMPGMGVSRTVPKLPDLNIHYIESSKELGGVLNFDPEQGKLDMRIGYLDAYRALYGLYGKKYYVDRTFKESEALTILANHYARTKKRGKLREIMEFVIPTEAIKLGVPSGSYYEILIALCESLADAKKMELLKLYTDSDFIKEAMS